MPIRTKYPPLTDDDASKMDRRARPWLRGGDGMLRTLAGDVIRLLAERDRLLAIITIMQEDDE